jgi:multisubunit Na+/H+ antiporter MnhG subunit
MDRKSESDHISTRQILMTKEATIYGIIGILCVILVYFYSNFGTDIPILMFIGAVFIFVWASSMAFVLWRIAFPVLLQESTSR